MPLLVLVDLSQPAMYALELAGALALAGEKDVFLVSIEAGPAPLSRLAELHRLAQPLREQGVRVLIRTCDGDPVDCIARQARQRRCSCLLVDDTHPQAREILAHSPIPTVAVGADGARLFRQPADAAQLGTTTAALAG